MCHDDIQIFREQSDRLCIARTLFRSWSGDLVSLSPCKLLDPARPKVANNHIARQIICILHCTIEQWERMRHCIHKRAALRPSSPEGMTISCTLCNRVILVCTPPQQDSLQQPRSAAVWHYNARMRALYVLCGHSTAVIVSDPKAWRPRCEAKPFLGRCGSLRSDA